LAFLTCHVSDEVANTMNKDYKWFMAKNKNIIMCYNMLVERWDKTEAIDILNVKIARGMKKLLIFNGFCLRDMSWNMENV